MLTGSHSPGFKPSAATQSLSVPSTARAGCRSGMGLSSAGGRRTSALGPTSSDQNAPEAAPPLVREDFLEEVGSGLTCARFDWFPGLCLPSSRAGPQAR